MMEVDVDPAPRSAGVGRRFGAMLYDSLLVAALLLVATAMLLPLTGGEAIDSRRFGTLRHVYQVLDLAIIVGFFGFFWTRRGQTLGMAAWRLKLEREDGGALTWPDALKRLAGAAVSLLACGAGYFWIWIDRDRLAWHDRWTRTRVTLQPKRSRPSSTAVPSA